MYTSHVSSAQQPGVVMATILDSVGIYIPRRRNAQKSLRYIFLAVSKLTFEEVVPIYITLGSAKNSMSLSFDLYLLHCE